MWMPALAALVSGRGPRALALRGLKKLGARHFAVAFLAGSAFEILSWVFVTAAGKARWNSDNFELDASGTHVQIRKLATLLGAIPSQHVALFALNLVLSVAFASLLLGVAVGVGEEIGWRGVLQPALVARLGFARGTLAVGLVWAYWHLPANLAGYNDAKHPVVSALLLFPIGAVALAFILGWVFRRSGSVWPCAIAHMANNEWSAGPLVKTPSWVAENTAHLAAAGVLIAVVLLLVRRRGDPPVPAGAWLQQEP
jgi:membrane protease YdiL (CAAX protease family)